MSSLDKMTPLMEVQQLQHLIETNKNNSAPQMFILDCTWLGLPVFQQRDPKVEFHQLRIPGAHFLDLDECCDKKSQLPHMLPSASQFQEDLGRICTTSIRSQDGSAVEPVEEIRLSRDIFIVYDSLGAWSAPRVWFMFKCFGAANVFILNGGLCAWMEQGFTVENKPYQQRQLENAIPVFGVSYNASLCKKLTDVQRFVSTSGLDKTVVLIDARPQGRFLGKDPEPRPDIPSGHVPGSHNIPWTSVLEEHTIKRDCSTLSGLFSDVTRKQVDYTYFTYKSPNDLQTIFEKNLKLSLFHKSKLVFSCGSGVSAVVVLAAAIISQFGNWNNVSLYDGSWVEWQLHSSGLLVE